MNQHSEHVVAVRQNRRSKFLRLAALAGGTGLLAATLLAPEARAGDPCCGVISVEAARGVVTAFERASGNIFSFSVKDKALLSSFKPCQGFDAKLGGVKAGQAFAADPGAVIRARVNPAEPCCEMTSAPGTAGRVLGVQPHAKFDGVEILLLELKRSDGGLATATCLYCNGGATRVDLASELRARASGAKLLDTANRVEYRIVRAGGPGGDAMVSIHHGGSDKLQPQQSVRTWMKFNAPAGDTATLFFPGAAAPFENVPLGK